MTGLFHLARSIHVVASDRTSFLQLKKYSVLFVYTVHSVYPFICRQALGVASTSWLWWIALPWACVCKYPLRSCFSSCGCISRSECCAMYVVVLFTIFRNHHTVFQSHCTVLHPHPKCTGLQSFHILTIFAFLNVAIRRGVRRWA